MIIDCIADLHGNYPHLDGGDLLIVAGDMVSHPDEQEYLDFYNWIRKQTYIKKIVIAGNHDTLIQREGPEWMGFEDAGFEYLCDSGTEFKGLKIWGSPWTKMFEGMNPRCKAFTVDTDAELAEKWEMIPDDTDILITHSPRYGLHDRVQRYDNDHEDENVGSKSLLKWIANHINTLKLHVCGHIHEGYGVYDIRGETDKHGDPRIAIMLNASHVNERYEPVNKPIRIIL